MKESELPEGVKLEWMGDRYRQIAKGGGLIPLEGWELIIPAIAPITAIFTVKSKDLALEMSLQYLKSIGLK